MSSPAKAGMGARFRAVLTSPETPIERRLLAWTSLLATSCGALVGGMQLLPDADSVALPAPAVSETLPPISDGSDRYDGGWWPRRETFTIEDPAPYAVLNSITDHPAMGDERNFVRVRNISESPDGDYAQIVRADTGDRVEVVAWVSNNAADHLAGSATTLHDLRATIEFPPPGTDLSIKVSLEAANAREVFDGATVITSTPAMLAAVPGTARMYTQVSDDNGFALDETQLATGSILLGHTSPDGEFPVGKGPNGEQYGVGWMSFTVQVERS